MLLMNRLPPEILDQICLAGSAYPGCIPSILQVSKYMHDCAFPHRYRRIFICGSKPMHSFLAHIEALENPPRVLCLILSDRPLQIAAALNTAQGSRTISRLIESILGALAYSLHELRTVLFEHYDVPDLFGAFHIVRRTPFPSLRELSIYLGAGGAPRRALVPCAPRLASLHLIGFGFDLVDLARETPDLCTLRLSGQLVSAPLASAMRRLFAHGVLPAGVREVRLDAERVQRFVRDPFLDEAYSDINRVVTSSAISGGPVLKTTWHTTKEQHLQDLLRLCFPGD